MMSSHLSWVRKAKLAAIAALTLGGTLITPACTSRDLQKNVVAGTLGYVKNGATSFWNNFIPMDDVWAGFFNPTPRE